MNSEKVRFLRELDIDLPQGQSAFLWGPRKVGKSTYLKKHFSRSEYIDLLKSDIFIKYHKSPELLRQEVLALPQETLDHPIIIDEVQKVPALLDEIHWLIENSDAYFILCGSSARKLKKTHANLLGGRAWRYQMFPLTSKEVPELDLLHIFNSGMIPSHFLSKNPKKSLDSYIVDYLTEEIKAESLVRNLPAFSRFLDAVAFSDGQMTNFSNISRECGIDSKTVQEYYNILVDTLLGYFVLPYSKQIKRQIISSTPKFYLCDVGISNRLAKLSVSQIKGPIAGKSFEQFIFLEINSYKYLKDKDFSIRYWRTKTNLEVDFILGTATTAIEVKLSDQISPKDIKGLIAFKSEHPETNAIVVCLADKTRKLETSAGDVTVLPWKLFLEKLWIGDFTN